MRMGIRQLSKLPQRLGYLLNQIVLHRRTMLRIFVHFLAVFSHSEFSRQLEKLLGLWGVHGETKVFNKCAAL